MSTYTIALLPELIASLSAEGRARCERLIHVERAAGEAVVPLSMQEWVEHHFGSVHHVSTQTIVTVTNLHTLESSMFNPLRAHRPLDDRNNAWQERDSALDEAIAAYAGANDMFQDPLTWTTEDVFGRIYGNHCVTASNVAKYGYWHGLVIFHEFHPLRFNETQLSDYFTVALRWLVKAHQVDPHARYPLIVWNCLWKSGASITHGHMHMILSRDMACGHVERWRRASLHYATNHREHLAEELWHMHADLGLTFHEQAGARGYVTITPLKDRELLLISNPIPELQQYAASDGGDFPDEALFAILDPLWRTTYRALHNLIAVQGVRSFNLAVYLPPFGASVEQWNDWTVKVRIVDRGDPLSRMVNIGAMEMFASSIISTDPFDVVKKLCNIRVTSP